MCLMNLILHSSRQLHCVCVLRDFLTAEDKEGVFNADHFPLWYKRAAEQVPGTFVYSIPFSTGMQNKKTHKCAVWKESSLGLHKAADLLLLSYLHCTLYKSLSIYFQLSSAALYRVLPGNPSGFLSHSAFKHLNQSFSISLFLLWIVAFTGFH